MRVTPSCTAPERASPPSAQDIGNLSRAPLYICTPGTCCISWCALVGSFVSNSACASSVSCARHMCMSGTIRAAKESLIHGPS